MIHKIKGYYESRLTNIFIYKVVSTFDYTGVEYLYCLRPEYGPIIIDGTITFYRDDILQIFKTPSGYIILDVRWSGPKLCWYVNKVIKAKSSINRYKNHLVQDDFNFGDDFELTLIKLIKK